MVPTAEVLQDPAAERLLLCADQATEPELQQEEPQPSADRDAELESGFPS